MSGEGFLHLATVRAMGVVERNVGVRMYLPSLATLSVNPSDVELPAGYTIRRARSSDTHPSSMIIEHHRRADA